jgi:hypothetical protein
MLATNSDQRRVAASRGAIRAQNWTQTYQNTENFDRENKTQNHTLIDFEGKKKIRTISRFMRVILAQGPC